MRWIITRMKWIMLLSGGLTCTMFYAVVAPQAALVSMFGDSLNGPLAEIVVRNWGALVTLVGAMLIFGAFRPSQRPLILIVASISKLIFIALVLNYGRHYLEHQIGFAIAVDAVVVAMFVIYLVANRRGYAAA